MIISNYHRRTVRLAASCLMAGLLVGCSGAEDRQGKYLSKAEEYFAENNLEKARVEIKNVLQINPKNTEARVLLGKLSAKEGEYRQAYLNFNAAVDENPEYADARLELAKILYAAQQDDQSFEHIRKALELEPNNADAKIVLAGLQVRAGSFEPAEALANEVLSEDESHEGAIAVLVSLYAEKDPNKALALIDTGLKKSDEPETLKNLKLSVLVNMKDAAAVEALLKELAAEYPETTDYRLRLARGYAFQNRLDEAEEALLEAVKANPEEVNVKRALVEFLAQRRGLEPAESKVKSFIEEDSENFVYREMLAQIYMANERPQEAKGVYRSIVELDPNGSNALQARNALATMSLQEGDRESAETLLAEIFAIEPSNTLALISRSRIALSDGDLDSAIADLRAALKNDAENLDALRLLAAAQERNGSPRLALEAYAKINELAPTDASAIVNAGRLSLQDNQIVQAERFFVSALKVDETNIEAINQLSRLYVNQKKWDKAEELADRLLDDESKRASGLVIKAGVNRAQENWGAAKSYYEEALQLAPTAFEPVGGYVDTFLIEKDYDGAIGFLNKHLESHPELMFAREILAKVHTQAGNTEKAADIYRSLIKENPNVEGTYHKLATLFVNQGDTKKAEAVYLQGLDHNAGFTGLRLFLANLYQSQEDFKRSKEQYEMVLAVRPDYEVVRNNLAVLLINYFPSEANFQRAMELTADLAKSREPVYLDTLGWVHYHLGNLPQAISYLEAAVNRGQSNPEYHYHLGMAYHKNGQKEKAKAQLALAVENKAKEYFGIEEAKQTLAML